MSSGADILARLTKKVDLEVKPVVLFHSLPGLGKTSLAASFPKPLFVTDGRDKGYCDLVRSGLIEDQFAPLEVADWQSLVEATKALADPTTPLDCETVVFENLGGYQLHLMEKLIADEVKATGKSAQFVTDKFSAWNMQGIKAGVSAFSDWFRTASSITERTNSQGKPIRVIFNGHSTLVKDKNVTGAPGEEFLRVDLDLHPELLRIVHRDCGCIGWLRQRPMVIKNDNGGAGKVLADDIREIVFHATAQATAKNRWGITEAIPMGPSAKHGYAALGAAIVAAKKSRTQSTGEAK